MLITPSFLSQVMLERRLSIAQLVLLLGLFVFMALTRGSSAASIARISNRRRSTYIGHGRLDRMGSIYSARGMSPSASTDQFYSHLQQGNRPSVSFEQQIAPEDQEPDTTRPKPASKGRGASSHNRSSSGLGLASENRPVRLPRSSRPHPSPEAKATRDPLIQLGRHVFRCKTNPISRSQSLRVLLRLLSQSHSVKR